MLSILLLIMPSALAQEPPQAAIQLSASTIATGTYTTVTVVLDAPSPVTSLQLSTDLPSNADVFPGSLVTDCLGAVDIDSGTLTHDLDRFVGTCRTSFDMTLPTATTLTLDPGTPTSSAGGDAPVPRLLTVVDNAPLQVLSVSPDVGPVGTRRQATLSVSGLSTGFSFAQTTLSLVIDGPGRFVPGGVTDVQCTPSVSFPPTIRPTDTSLSVTVVGDLSSCTLTTPVQTNGLDTATLRAQAPTGFGLQTAHGFAQARFSSPQGPVQVSVADAHPGQTVPMTVRLFNASRDQLMDNVNGQVDLQALLTGLVVASTPADGFCGPSSSATGTEQLTLSNVQIPAGTPCEATVLVQVPSTAQTGSYFAQTTPFAGERAGQPITLDAGHVGLNVDPALDITLTIEPSPVGAGRSATLIIDVVNNGPSVSALGTTLDLGAWLPGLEFDPATIDGCGPDTAVQRLVSTTNDQLQLSGLTVSAGESCTATLPITLPTGAPDGLNPTETAPFVGVIDTVPVTFRAVPVSVSVVSGPTARLAFDDARLSPGDSTDLVLTLTQHGEAGRQAAQVTTALSVDESLLVGAPDSPTDCGPNAVVTENPLQISDAAIAAGAVCSLRIPVSIPSDASLGVVTASTAAPTAVVDGVETTSTPALASLRVSDTSFTVDLSPRSGGVDTPFTVEHRLANNTDEPLLSAQIQIPLSQSLPDFDLVSAEASPECGATPNVSFSPANVGLSLSNQAPGTTCQLDLSFAPRADTPAGEYAYTPPSFVAIYATGSDAVSAPALPFRIVDRARFDAAFSPQVTTPGGTTALHYTLTANDDLAWTDLSFTHDLSAAIPGLIATNTPLDDVCGAGSSLTGSNVLTLTGGSLDATGRCSVQVELLAPPTVPFTGPIAVPTSTVTYLRGESASATLDAASPTLAFVPNNCRDGFANVNGLCVDVDECSEGLAGCDPIGTCTNTPGAFECACPAGYGGDGFVCTDIDECEQNVCGAFAACTNTPGDVECACIEGTQGDPFDGCEPLCGDGLLIGEACDDGNVEDADGCSAACTVEDGFACTGEPSTCTALCGNGQLDGDEECDDGADNAPEGPCLPDCTLADTESDTDPDTGGETGSGCSCTSGHGAPTAWWVALFAFGLLGLRATRTR